MGPMIAFAFLVVRGQRVPSPTQERLLSLLSDRGGLWSTVYVRSSYVRSPYAERTSVPRLCDLSVVISSPVLLA